MSTSPFPFTSASPPQTPTTTNNPPFGTPSTPQSLQPDTLPIRTNPFNYVVVKNQAKNPFESLQAQAASPEAPNPFQYQPNLPRPLPRAHSRGGSSSPPCTEAIGKSLINPFSDANRITSLTPTKPDRKKSHKEKHYRDVSANSSIASSVTFNTAIGSHSCSHVPYKSLSRDLLPSLSKDKGHTRRGKLDSCYSLDREVRLREVTKQQDRKLRLERAKDEVRRLSNSISSRRFYPSQGPEIPIPSLLSNGFFWAALLLAQAGLVSTGAAFAVILKDKKVGEDVSVGTGTVFWLVCSVGGLIVGFVSAGLIGARKGNCCLGTQERLGLNEIQGRVIGDEEQSRSEGKGLLYLGVGERKKGSVLGGFGREHADAVKMRDETMRDGTVVGCATEGIGKESLEKHAKDPTWRDLYLTPSNTRPSVSRRCADSGAKKECQEEIVGVTDSKDPNLDTQPQRLTRSPIGASNDAEYYINTRIDRDVSGMAAKGARQERQAEYPRGSSSVNSIYSRTSTLNDWTSAIGKEVHNWSPLERLERVLSGHEVKASSEGKKMKDEGMELVDLSISQSRATDQEIAKGQEPVEKNRSSSRLVGEQIAEYHGSWSPEIIQQRMQQKKEEKKLATGS